MWEQGVDNFARGALPWSNQSGQRGGRVGSGKQDRSGLWPSVREELVGLYPCRDRCGLAGTLITSSNLSRNLQDMVRLKQNTASGTQGRMPRQNTRWLSVA